MCRPKRSYAHPHNNPVNKEHWLPPAPNILRKDIQAHHRTCALLNDLVCRLFVSGLSPKYIGSFFNKNSVAVNRAINHQYKDKYHIAVDFHRNRVDKEFDHSSKATKIFNRICKRLGASPKLDPPFGKHNRSTSRCTKRHKVS